MPKPLWEKNCMCVCVRNWWDKVFEGFIKGQPHCLSAKGTLILQLLGKAFHSDISAKYTISCSSCDQGFLWLFPHLLSVHKAGWMTVKWGRTESAQNSPTSSLHLGREAQNSPTSSLRLGRDTADAPALWGLRLPGPVPVGVGSSAVCLHALGAADSERELCLHSRSPWQQESLQAGRALLL